MKNKDIKFGSITKESLGRFLNDRLGNTTISVDSPLKEYAKKRNEFSKYKYDFIIEDHKTVVVLIEPEHFKSESKMSEQNELLGFACENEYNIITVPYFLQFTPDVIEALFGGLIKDYTPFEDNDLGFGPNAGLYPADYCDQGKECMLYFATAYNHYDFMRYLLFTLSVLLKTNSEESIVFPELKEIIDDLPNEGWLDPF